MLARLLSRANTNYNKNWTSIWDA